MKVKSSFEDVNYQIAKVKSAGFEVFSILVVQVEIFEVFGILVIQEKDSLQTAIWLLNFSKSKTNTNI